VHSGGRATRGDGFAGSDAGNAKDVVGIVQLAARGKADRAANYAGATSGGLSMLDTTPYTRDLTDSPGRREESGPLGARATRLRYLREQQCVEIWKQGNTSARKDAAKCATGRSNRRTRSVISAKMTDRAGTSAGEAGGRAARAEHTKMRELQESSPEPPGWGTRRFGRQPVRAFQL
jgi:hypothetical protein